MMLTGSRQYEILVQNWSLGGQCAWQVARDEGNFRTRMSDAEPIPNSRNRARRVADTITAQIERQIAEGELRPGERLQTERELAERFTASRAVVRSALQALADAGKISRHVGRGSYVAERPKPAETLIFPDVAPADMMELRCILEPSMIDLIMLNASNGDIDAILACVDEGDTASERNAWNALDDKFHRLLAAATHNRLIISLYDVFSAARQKGAWNRLKQQAVTQRLWRGFQAQHRAIADALKRGDRNAAYHATRDHIMQARANMLGYTVQLHSIDGDR